MTKSRIFAAAACMALFAVGGCGGGTEGTGATPEPAAALTVRGTMTRGSVVVNGIRFEPTAATRISDDRARTVSQLADGMVVRVRGRSDDRVWGRADLIDVENEVRAPIEAIFIGATPPRFVVGGITVVSDSNTTFANVPGFGSLLPGMRVEVHGLRDATGILRASRVEVVTGGADEIRGAIGVLDRTAKRFTINGTVVVDYAAARFLPSSANDSHLAAGTTVEVRGMLNNGVLRANEVAIEALQDASFTGDPGEPQEIEGYVSGFVSHPGGFLVGQRPVRTTADTRFTAGSAANLVNDIRVEVEGTVQPDGALLATRIEFKQARIALEGRATSVDTAARRLVVLGQLISLTDLTVIAAVGPGGPSDQLGDIRAGLDCVDVEGFMQGENVVAEVIKEENCNANGRSKVQAHVTSKDERAAALTFFASLRADLRNALLYDHDERPLTREQFFAAIRVAGSQDPGTLVEVKGPFDGTTIAGEEAELEE